MTSEPAGMNISGETMAQYYQRRANEERGADMEHMLTVMQSALDSLVNDYDSHSAERVLSACLKKYGR